MQKIMKINTCIYIYIYIYIYSPRCKLIATAHAWVSSFCWKILYNRLLVLGLILQLITRYWNVKSSVVFISSTLPTSLFKDSSCLYVVSTSWHILHVMCIPPCIGAAVWIWYSDWHRRVPQYPVTSIQPLNDQWLLPDPHWTTSPSLLTNMLKFRSTPRTWVQYCTIWLTVSNNWVSWCYLYLYCLACELLALRDFGKFLLDITSLLWAIYFVLIMILGNNKWHMTGNWHSDKMVYYKPINIRSIAHKDNIPNCVGIVYVTNWDHRTIVYQRIIL